YEIMPFATPANGRAFGVAESFIKMHPVRYSCQLPIDTAQELRLQVSPEEIETLQIETFQSIYDRAVKNPEFWAPKTRETGDHSMPITVAMALADGEVTPNSFIRERFRAPDVLNLVKRTNVVVSEEFTKAAPSVAGVGVRNCRITATTKRGTV